MDFELTEAQVAATERARSLVADVLAALPSEPAAFARGAHAALGSRGFFAPCDTVAIVRRVAELGRGSASLGALAASGWLFAEALRLHGAATRPALVAAASDGSTIGCVALDDPRRRGGLRAVSANGGFRFEGTLELVPNAPIAEHVLVVAAGEGSSLVIAHLDGTLLDERRGPPGAGIGFARLPRSKLDLAGVTIDSARVLASGAHGKATGEKLIDVRRILTAAISLGLAERATARAIAHVRAERPRPSQNTEFLLADLATDLEAATLAVTRAAWLRDTSAPHTLEAAAGKLLATRAATRAAHGALGVVGEPEDTDELRRAYLDARALEMQDGARAEQQDTIASVMLGER
jgi:alkylation response protein AidB-like acyl-CoA dehydrogenase